MDQKMSLVCGNVELGVILRVEPSAITPPNNCGGGGGGVLQHAYFMFYVYTAYYKL